MPLLWMFVAFLLVFLEFFLPGGIMGMAATVFFVLSWISAYQTYGPVISILFFFISVVFCGIVVWFALKRLQKNTNTFRLQADQEGYEGVDKKSEYIGKHGVAVTDLGPAGFIVIEGQRLQVVCQARYIEKGEKVIVIESRGGYLLVKPSN